MCVWGGGGECARVEMKKTKTKKQIRSNLRDIWLYWLEMLGRKKKRKKPRSNLRERQLALLAGSAW